MSTRKAKRQPKARTLAVEASPSIPEDTASRLRAYLASMRPMRGIADVYDQDEYQRGRSLIEHVALSARGDEHPSLKLSSSECADVLHFMHFSEPVRPNRWWDDPPNGPSHLVGFYLLLQTLDRSLRSKHTRGAT